LKSYKVGEGEGDALAHSGTAQGNFVKENRQGGRGIRFEGFFHEQRQKEEKRKKASTEALSQS